jgi:phenylalanyl-tRNA synthetase alpha chain
MAEIDVKILAENAEKEIKEAKSSQELDEVLKKYIGKQGEISLVLRSLADLNEEQRRERGKAANELKVKIEVLAGEKKKELGIADFVQDKKRIDVTFPGKKPPMGHLHPITLARKEIGEIFMNMGFSIIDGPEIEDEWHNFDALNIPKDHPARDMWDTFWIKQKDQKMLLRTHTSPVQIRFMEKNKPPFRIIAPGRIFRHEATDARHETNFYQVEGLMVDKDISVANFKFVIEKFFSKFFGKELKARLRPSFFPFTEPSFEVDISCVVCGQKGCSTCSNSGWLEIMGAGMVHPIVLKNCGIDSGKWQGFAFGIGLDRLVMMKYGIEDVRLFYSGDLRFLEQF